MPNTTVGSQETISAISKIILGHRLTVSSHLLLTVYHRHSSHYAHIIIKLVWLELKIEPILKSSNEAAEGYWMTS